MHNYLRSLESLCQILIFILYPNLTTKMDFISSTNQLKKIKMSPYHSVTLFTVYFDLLILKGFHWVGNTYEHECIKLN